MDEWGKVPQKEFIEPGLEYERYLQITRLRTLYTDLCMKYLSKVPPEQSFNRWLFAQLTTSITEKKDVFLSEPDLAVDCRVLQFEIQRNIPADRYIKYPFFHSFDTFFEPYMLDSVPETLSPALPNFWLITTKRPWIGYLAFSVCLSFVIRTMTSGNLLIRIRFNPCAQRWKNRLPTPKNGLPLRMNQQTPPT